MTLIQLITRNVISIFAGLFLTVLALRLAFRLLALPASNTVVDFVYALSGRMLAPLDSVLSLPAITIGGNHVLDTAAFIAILVYALAASLLLSLFARVWQPARRV